MLRRAAVAARCAMLLAEAARLQPAIGDPAARHRRRLAAIGEAVVECAALKRARRADNNALPYWSA